MKSGKNKNDKTVKHKSDLRFTFLIICRIILWAIAILFLGAIFIWTLLAIRYLNFNEIRISGIVPAVIYLLAVLLAYILLKNRWRTTAFLLTSFILVHTYFVHIEPDSGGVYPPETALMPRIVFHDGDVTIKGIRNFRYESEDKFTVDYYDRTIDLGDIQTVDYIISYWTEGRNIAHGFVSFGLKDGTYIPVSIEIRRQVGDAYGVVKGLFKQFQLIYIWADERDIIALRTNYRKEDVYLYRSLLTPDECRRLFFDMAMRTEKLAVSPEFYNTLTQNCTSSIIEHLARVAPDRTGRAKRYLLNGYTDKIAFDGGLILPLGNFEETKEKSYIDLRAEAYGVGPEFSKKIRSHIPETHFTDKQ